VIAFAAVPSAAQAAFPGANGKIVFAQGSQNLAVVTVDPDGSGFAKLTNEPNLTESQATWSPDGRKIAYVGFWGGVAVMAADGSGKRGLSFPPNGSDDAEPTWSPDGSQIAFSRLTSGHCRVQHCGEHLFVMNADGSGVTQLTSGTDLEIQPAWSPDGSRIAFSRISDCDPGPCEEDVYTIKPDGSDLTMLTEPGVRESDPNWSPDGKQIAFVSNRFGGPGAAQIFTMDADGSNNQVVTRSQGGYVLAEEPAWSPDGKRIAFVWIPNGACQTAFCGFEVFTVRPDGTDYQRVTNNGLREESPDWQPLNRPPDCSSITANPLDLWPPNHQFGQASVSGGSDPDGDQLALAITAVSQDEAVTSRSDNTAPDARSGSAPGEVLLRAERNPSGDGRVYHLTVRATDASGNTCEGDVTVQVRRHQNVPSVDSAPPSFDSFGG
jgi:TolB protein